jgi:hypothetical protein
MSSIISNIYNKASIKNIFEYLSPFDPNKPFCDHDLKWLRLLTDSTINTCCFLFSKATAQIAWISHSKNWDYYEVASSFYKLKIIRLLCYAMMKDNLIIDFSINMPSSFDCIKNFETDKKDEIGELKKFYGKEQIDDFLKIFSPTQMPIIKKNLSRIGFDDHEFVYLGCCFGSSLSFITQYFGLLKKGNSSSAAIKLSSRVFREGAPKESQLLQIFSNTVGYVIENEAPYISGTQPNIKEEENLNKIENQLTEVEERLRTREILNEILGALSEKEDLKEISLQLADLKEKILKRKQQNKRRICIPETDEEYIKYINQASLYELQSIKNSLSFLLKYLGNYNVVDQMHYIYNSSIQGSDQDELRLFIDKLPLGVYVVQIGCYEGLNNLQSQKETYKGYGLCAPHHIVALIKTEDQYCIFDSNLAIILVSQKKIEEMIDKFIEEYRFFSGINNDFSSSIIAFLFSRIESIN